MVNLATYPVILLSFFFTLPCSAGQVDDVREVIVKTDHTHKQRGGTGA